MNTINHAQVEQQSRDLLDRWWKIINSSTPTNHDLANEAVCALYRIVKRKPAPAIVWCQSPFQMAVIPTLLANILPAAEWAELVANMTGHGATGCDLWNRQWPLEWETLEKRLVAPLLYDQILKNDRYLRVGKRARDAVLVQIQEQMRLILAEGKLAPGNPFKTKRKKPAAGQSESEILWPPPVDLTMLKHLVWLRVKVDEIADVRFGTLDAMLSLPWAWFGVFDQRLISHYLPSTSRLFEKAKRDPEVQALIQRAKDRSSNMEMLSLNMMTWYMGLFGIPRAPAVAAAQEIAEGVQPKPSTLSIARTVLNSALNSYETEKEILASRPANDFQPLCCWLPYSTMWLPFALGCRFIDPNFFGELQEEVDNWAYLAHSANGLMFAENVCFICEKPAEFCTNNGDGRPHSGKGPAAVWSDSFEVYCWRGVNVPAELINEPDSITADRINRATNAELRRVMIDLFGEARYLRESGAKVIHEDEFGTLYRQEIPHDEALVMVRVRNSSPEPDGSYKHYYLRVPPEMLRARQAVAWTFSYTDEKDYNPWRQT